MWHLRPQQGPQQGHWSQRAAQPLSLVLEKHLNPWPTLCPALMVVAPSIMLVVWVAVELRRHHLSRHLLQTCPVEDLMQVALDHLGYLTLVARQSLASHRLHLREALLLADMENLAPLLAMQLLWGRLQMERARLRVQAGRQAKSKVCGPQQLRRVWTPTKTAREIRWGVLACLQTLGQRRQEVVQ